MGGSRPLKAFYGCRKGDNAGDSGFQLIVHPKTVCWFTAEERVEAKNNKEGEMITLIIALIIITVVTVFSVQNAIPVVISFLFWKFEASLAIILFLSVLAGVVIGVSAASLFRMKLSKK